MYACVVVEVEVDVEVEIDVDGAQVGFEGRRQSVASTIEGGRQVVLLGWIWVGEEMPVLVERHRAEYRTSFLGSRSPCVAKTDQKLVECYCPIPLYRTGDSLGGRGVGD